MHGISRLRRYSRKFNEALGVYLGPLHDENRHAADAFGEFAINCGIKALAGPGREAARGCLRASFRIPPPPSPQPGLIVLR